MADALLSIVLDRLASLIQQQFHHEVCLVVGVKREIQSLTNTLQIVRAVVADAEKRQVNEEPVKVWLERLKDIAYQMDDVLDEWSTAFLKSQIERVESPSMPKKKVSSCIPSPCICFKRVARRRDIALKIKGIKQEVDDIANQSSRFNFTSRFSNEEPQRFITISAVDISEVWGRDKDRDTILRQLLGKSCEQSLGLYTISVVGMGGQSSDLHDPEALQQKIQESIDGKKFLLVLDDVWTEDYQLWEQLKNCLKCGGDHTIQIDDLIKLWMAQSYLDSKSDREMETIGREYFENLAAQSFFQDFEKDDKGNIVRCKIHDRVHDFAQFLTNNECLIVEDDCENLKTNLSLQKVRHATVIVHGSTRFSFSVNNARNLHTLLVVSDNALKTLPETICGLCNLKTLDVRLCLGLRKLPQGMGNLVNFRHFLFTYCDQEFSEQISLAKGCKIEEMRNLKELRGRLEIRGLVNVEDAEKAEKAELKNKKHLHGLTLHFTTGRMQERMKKVAEALQPHPNLKSLSIVQYQVREWPRWMMEPSLLQLTHLLLSYIACQCLPPLGELPLLENLNIQYMPRVKYVGGEFLGSSSAIAFPRLKHLSFSEMQEWEIWEVKEEGRKVMPSLLSLKISASPKLATLPDLLQRTPPLDLSFKYCNILQGKWPWLLKVTARV
ncbi:hypothetical protein AAG906_018894 [Vitis piasezkii]